MRRPALLLLAFALTLVPAAPAAAAKSGLRVTPKRGTPTTVFRVAFRPQQTTGPHDTYVVRMDWRGKRAPKGCDRYASVEVTRAKRWTWKAVRLRPNAPRRAPRWCAGTWVGRVVERHTEDCDGDEICRDTDEDWEEQRWYRRIVATPVRARAAKAKGLKVTPRVASPRTPFRIAFRPKRSLMATDEDRYVVRMDWRGGRAKRCDRFATVDLYAVRRGRWKAVRLRPDTPRRHPRWCKGTWSGRILHVVVDDCGGDEICRDPDEYTTVERRFTRRVR